jgi:hypothetical protein
MWLSDLFVGIQIPPDELNESEKRSFMNPFPSGLIILYRRNIRDMIEMMIEMLLSQDDMVLTVDP